MYNHVWIDLCVDLNRPRNSPLSSHSCMTRMDRVSPRIRGRIKRVALVADAVLRAQVAVGGPCQGLLRSCSATLHQLADCHSLP